MDDFYQVNNLYQLLNSELQKAIYVLFNHCNLAPPKSRQEKMSNAYLTMHKPFKRR